MSNFSKTLRAIRNSNGITQADLANAVGVSKSSINMYERGEREPSIATLEKIAKHFNVSINMLLGNDEAYRDVEKYNASYNNGIRNIARKYNLLTPADCEGLTTHEIMGVVFGTLQSEESRDTLRLALSLEMALLAGDAQSHVIYDGNEPSLNDTLRSEVIESIKKLRAGAENGGV